MVQRPLRATAGTKLYLASQPDSQPTVHAPCHDPGRGHGSECLPNGFGSRGNGVWLFVNSLPDKKSKTCSRNIYAQIILSNEITFHDSGQMIFFVCTNQNQEAFYRQTLSRFATLGNCCGALCEALIYINRHK